MPPVAVRRTPAVCVASTPSAAPRRGLVSRTQLVRRLIAARDTPLVLLVAPAGYGKSTLLSEWSLHDGRPFVWVGVGGERIGHEAIGSLTELVETHGDGVVLVFDGAGSLAGAEAMEVVSELVEQLPAGSQVVLASRTEPALGLGALRAQRKLLELRPADLTLSTPEAGELIRAHGFELDHRELELLVQRAEGWPAALCLAALAARGENHPARALAGFAGDDRFMSDYIDDELLADLPAREFAFLLRSSVLDTLSGSLCDHVLERADSARVLKALSKKNLMLVPLDRSDAEYRYQRLFAQALRAELARSDPEREAKLHRRASSWYHEHGDAERSIEHAIAAGDVALAGDRLWSNAAQMLGHGQTDKLSRWLGRFSKAQVGACRELALTAAAVSLFAGDRTLVEFWTACALRSDGSGAVRDGEIQLIRSAVAEESVIVMGAKAEAADVPDDSAWRALADFLLGVTLHMTAERDVATRLLERGARHAGVDFPSMQCLCLAQLCLLAIEREDWNAAESLAARAKAQVERSGLAGYPTSALVYAVSADVQAHLGRVESSRVDAHEASELLAKIVDFVPWYEAECRIALARATLRLSEVPRARELLAEAAERLQRSPDALVAAEWLASCQTQAEDSASASARSEWCLTTAELRVLQFLPTHLSLPEVADRLFVSANTVKTHARSIYRKLGASGRGEAVALAREGGLLDQASHAGIGTAGILGLS